MISPHNKKIFIYIYILSNNIYTCKTSHKPHKVVATRKRKQPLNHVLLEERSWTEDSWVLGRPKR